jgi:formate-dependent nitrite reductase membrane component NrfD
MAPIQVPDWPWYFVAVYFFIGGLAAGGYLLAAMADVFGDSERDKPLIRTGTYMAAVLVIICPLLLTLDLGRPERFWRMLTHAKLLSPVSLGSWGLFLFGLFVILSAVIWLALDGRLPDGLSRLLIRLPRRLIMRVGAFFGIFVAGYTGVLLSSTVVPFWNSNQLLGLTFLVSALSTSIAIVSLLLIWQGQGNIVGLHNFRALELVLLAFEVFLIVWQLLIQGGDLLLTGQFLFTFVIAVAVVGVAAPLILLLVNLDKTMSTGMLTFVAVLVLVGGFFYRYSILVAGQQSVEEQVAWLIGLLAG